MAYPILQPNDARTLLNMGRLYEALGNEAEARRYFESAVAADPTYVDPQLDLVRLDRAAGRSRQALDCTERVLGVEPDSGSAWLVKGVLLAGVYRELGRTRDAERARRRAKALSAPPLDPDAAEGQT